MIYERVGKINLEWMPLYAAWFASSLLTLKVFAIYDHQLQNLTIKRLFNAQRSERSPNFERLASQEYAINNPEHKMIEDRDRYTT